MDLVELAVNGRLAVQVLAVQPFDNFMGWLLALEVGVVAIAEVELAARRGVVAEPPGRPPLPAQATFSTAESTLCPVRRSSMPVVICETP